jgi:hypothetical protein
MRSKAEDALRFICVGRHIVGIHFHGSPVLLLDYPGRGCPQLLGHLLVECGWVVAESGPIAWPENDVWLPERPVEELAQAAARLRDAAIHAARLGPTAAHLALQFDNGATLMLAGSHPTLTPWELNAGGPTVRALPGGGVWTSWGQNYADARGG